MVYKKKTIVDNFFGYSKDSLMMDNLSAVTTFTNIIKCIPNNLPLSDTLLDAEVIFSLPVAKNDFRLKYIGSALT